MTALENQIAKLSNIELRYFNLLNDKGIYGEEALSHVLLCSETGLLK